MPFQLFETKRYAEEGAGTGWSGPDRTERRDWSAGARRVARLEADTTEDSRRRGRCPKLDHESRCDKRTIEATARAAKRRMRVVGERRLRASDSEGGRSRVPHR